MKEVLIPYILICWLLIKFEYVKFNLKNMATMIGIAMLILFLLLLGSRYFAVIDMTKTTIVKSQQILLMTPAGGDIDKIYVSHNQRIKAGQPIFSYSTKRYEIQRASLVADLKKQTVMMENFRQNYNRVKDLGGEIISKNDVNNAKTNFESQLEVVEQAKSKIADLDWLIEHALVSAPVDGTMNIIYISEGQYFSEGRPASMILFTDKKFLEMRIPDQSYPFIQEHAFAEFYLDVYPGRIFRGRVQSVGQNTGEAQASMVAFQAQSVSQNFMRNQGYGRTVIIEFEEPEGVIIPIGATGQAWIMGTKEYSILGMFDLLAGVLLRLNAVEAYFGAW